MEKVGKERFKSTLIILVTAVLLVQVFLVGYSVASRSWLNAIFGAIFALVWLTGIVVLVGSFFYQVLAEQEEVAAEPIKEPMKAPLKPAKKPAVPRKIPVKVIEPRKKRTAQKAA